MLTRASVPIAVVLAGVCCLATFADDDTSNVVYRMEIGVQGGFFLPDDDVSSKDTRVRDMEPVGGPRFAVNFAQQFDWFIDGTLTDTNANTSPSLGPIGDVETLALRSGVNFYFKPHDKKVQWFVGAGVGIIDVDIELAQDFQRNFASLSAGQRVRLDKRANFRWEARVDQYFDDNDILKGQDVTRWKFLISVNWGLKRIDGDADGDGVPDSRDDCPDTPHGAIVDEHGCPKDSDGDGVWDGIDRCPDTPRGATVDEWGCPSDSDGDGVWDGIDRCPDTPRGATVDEWGCPSDSDGDGVWDGIDRCPGTPRGATVDEWGCPSDSDGDGVWDGIDQCPDTPHGTPVRSDGCPKVKKLFTPEKQTLILEGVFFEFDEAILKSISEETLNRVAQSMLDWPAVRVEVAGHTDWDGPEEYNENLSLRRAQSVKDYLVAQGVAEGRLKVSGYGESRPVADNSTQEGRATNRRVEVNKLD